jgi:hypothetical protein
MSDLSQETIPPKRLYPKRLALYDYPKCSNGFCQCNTASECHAFDDIQMTCSPKVWRDSCGARERWDKLNKLFR